MKYAMGLDMYLTKKTFVMPDESHVFEFPDKWRLARVKYERISTIIEDVGYWRKANAIHKWFVDNVQDGKDDCGDYEVSKEAMQTLLFLVHSIIAKPDMAEVLLPTQEGFFFGNTEYGEDYFEDLEITKGILTGCLKEIKEDSRSSFFYHSSW